MPSVRENQRFENFGPALRETYPWKAILLSGTFFLLMMLTYAGMEFGYRPFLLSEKEKLEEVEQQLNQNLTITDEAEVLLFNSQLANLRYLLGKHTRPSSFMSVVEQQTIQSAYYSGLTLNFEEQEVAVTGATDNYQTALRQAHIFEELDAVKGVQVSKVSANEGVVEFEMTLSIASSTLLFSAPAQPQVRPAKPVQSQ